jgi:glycosyltransferase involved in cell wall biosynthesis
VRILYVCTYQGPDLVAQRSIRRNRALGGSRKMELVVRMLQARGHEVVVLSAGIPAERSMQTYTVLESSMPPAPGSSDGSHIIYAAAFDVRLFNYLTAVWSSIRLLREGKLAEPFGLLMMYNIDDYVWPVSRFFLRFHRDVPVVLQYEDAVSVKGRGTGLMRRMIWTRMERWLRPRLAGVVGVNANLVARMRNSNTQVLPGVVDDDLCRAARTRRPPLAGPAPFLAVFCGSLTNEKGAEMIPRVAGRFRGRVRFVIAGVGPLLDRLSTMARDCDGDVEVVGYLERPELNKLLVSSDILLNPHDDEGSGGIFPFKVVEYLVAGGVVVTTRAGSGDDPLLDFCQIMKPCEEDMSSAIESVLASPDEAGEQAAAGQEWATRNYSMEAVSHDLDRLIEKASHRHPGHTSP